MSKILKETDKDFPFKWANLSSYRDSDAFRKEVYLKDQRNIIENLIFLFFSLFGKRKNKLIIYNESWWDFCLETWDISQDKYNYDLDGKSDEAIEYLKILKESQIRLPYTRCCSCEDWDKFLPVVLKCIISHKAPYSPLFCDLESNYFFYFHETGSIGIYYKEENDVLKQILLRAHEVYSVED